MIKKISNQTTQGDQWKSIALLLENVMKHKGMNRAQLAGKVGVHRSTIKRFFELDFCLRFDIVLSIAKELELNILFEEIIKQDQTL